ncbi:hypothetical protein [Paenibacillus sedimenti]|uniref:YtkA-like domain-containing protein n=1 Tax=Paenibacillus sedimenti TaxID=2770274 RepID=A0A926QLX7_9BACL|nr:hypothetical protein [Paenibacillus sedimenti]MBD0383052.1 hypothetical protein [Paenibacillus sedimenti]
MNIFKSLCAIAATAMLLSGCGTAKSNSTTVPSYIPTLEVSANVNGDSATLQITTDLILSKQHKDQARQQGEGHIHYSLDGGEKQVLTDKQEVLEHLSKGSHSVKLSLHNNDHTPYEVSKTISFEVK